jgi:chemotaxis protein CheX
MQVEHINAFIEAVCGLFTSKLGCEAKRHGDIGLTKSTGSARDMSAFIGLSGQSPGAVALSFPSKTALLMASRIRGTEIRVIDETVTDVVAELVKIVATEAKTALNKRGITIDLSLPTVIRGSNHSLTHPSNTVWLDVPFTSELGPFSLRVTFDLTGTKETHE